MLCPVHCKHLVAPGALGAMLGHSHRFAPLPALVLHRRAAVL